MMGTILLASTAVLLRSASAAFRHAQVAAPLRVLGCLLGAGSAWILACGADAWSPVWAAAALGMICGLLELRFDSPMWRRAVDAGGVLLIGFASPATSPGPLLVAAVFLAAVGLATDRLAALLTGPAARRIVWASAGLAAVAVPVGWTQMKPELNLLGQVFHEDPLAWLHFSLMRKTLGERVDLETGAVAWLERPSGPQTSVGAVLFHGNTWEASRQKSACVLRRSLLGAGYVVLSVDHPGYGASPAPGADASLEAWDPGPTGLAAIRAIRRVAGVQRVVVIGHSMGCGDVLRVLAQGESIQAAILFGAGLRPAASWNDYWSERFRRDRRLDDSFPAERVRQIDARWYRSEDMLAALASARVPGTPLTFAQFGFEHRDNERLRDVYYAMLPEPKRVWVLENATHYFNTLNLGEIVVGDTRVTAAIRDRLADLHSELKDRAVAVQASVGVSDRDRLRTNRTVKEGFEK